MPRWPAAALGLCLVAGCGGTTRSFALRPLVRVIPGPCSGERATPGDELVPIVLGGCAEVGPVVARGSAAMRRGAQTVVLVFPAAAVAPLDAFVALSVGQEAAIESHGRVVARPPITGPLHGQLTVTALSPEAAADLAP